MILGLCFTPDMMAYVQKGFFFTPLLSQYLTREGSGKGWRAQSVPKRKELCILYLFELAYDLCLDQDHVLSEAPGFESMISYQYYLANKRQIEKAILYQDS